MKILLVEDEYDISVALGFVLESAGYEVLWVPDGSKALTMLEIESIDLVISDIMMPYLNGIQLLEKIRQHPKYYQIPVILMSAGTNPSSTGQTYQAFLEKPLDINLLLEIISKIRPRNGTDPAAV